MSILAEAEKQMLMADIVENSKGMTLVNILAVGKAGFFIGTPETATATLGTALRGLGVRVRRNVEWAEQRACRQLEGQGSKGRKRGKGSQIRRQQARQQKGFRAWQLRAVEKVKGLEQQLQQQSGQVQSEAPGAASTQGLGNARSFRLLWQLGEAKQALKKEVRLKEKAEGGLMVAEAKNANLLKAYSWDAQADLRRAKEETARVILQRQELEHKLKVRKRDLEEAHQYEGRQEVRMAELQQQLDDLRAGVKAAAGQQVAGQRAGDVAFPETIRKVEDPKPGLSRLRPQQLQMGPVDVPGIYVDGPETYMGTVVSVPDVARNAAGRFRLRVQMPLPAKVDFFVEADLATGAKIKVSVMSRVYAVERQ